MTGARHGRSVFGRLVRIWSTLLSGTAFAQVLNLVAFAIAARALPLEVLGGIALIQGAARMIDGLLNIRSGVALTTYCARFEATNDKDGFVGLLKAGLMLDFVTAVAAAILAACALAVFADDIGVPTELADYAPYYALAVLASVPGLHLAVLRTFDRYAAIAISECVCAVLRVIFFVVCVLTGADPIWFLIAWLIADIVAQILPLGLAVKELKRRRYPSLLTANARAAIAEVPGFWRMIWTTNLTTSVRALSEQGDMVLVGWLAGPAAAGVFRIAKTAAAPVLQLGFPIQQAAFPALARLHAEGKYARFMRDGAMYCAIGAGVGGCCLVGAWLAGPLILWLIEGNQNSQAIPVMVALVAAYAVYLGGIALLPMASALEKMDGFLIGTMTSAVTFFALAPFMIGEWGVTGAAFALIAHNIVWFVVSLGAVWLAYLRLRPAGVRK